MGARPIIGTPSAATARKRSGRICAACHAIDAPQSLPESVDQPDQIADHIQRRVLPHVRGAVAGAVTAQIGRDRKITGLRKRPELMPPRMRSFGKAMAENDQGAGALRHEVEANAIGLDKTLAGFKHAGSR
jgi:hypothetical protein